MPIQVSEGRFVQFVYTPDYLMNKNRMPSISDTDSICQALKLVPHKSSIVLEGGNVVKTSNKVIMTTKVFKENPNIPEKKLIKDLKTLFEVDQIIFIPPQPYDFTGHADGMVRFLDEKTVLINRYGERENKQFQQAFRLALNNAGLDYIEVPYNPYRNKKSTQANGIYINYLQMQGVIVLPTFGILEDEHAVQLLEQLFPKQQIITVDSNEIADDGGHTELY